MPTTNFKVGEMLNKRTRNSKTWMNFDGSYTTEVHSGAVHFVDEHSNLQNINTDLYDEADFDVIDEPVSVEGVERFGQARKETRAAKKNDVLDRSQHNFQALRVPFDAHIPRNFQRGYTIGKGADKLTFKPVKASPSTGELSQTDRSAIVYQDVWNDTDVELKVLANGLKETLYLKTDKAPSSFAFEVKGKAIAADLTAGALKLLPAWLVDAAGTYRDVEQNVVTRSDNKVYVELVAPVDGLVYPIEIDPTVVIQPDEFDGQDVYIAAGSSSVNYNDRNDLQVGQRYGINGQALIRFSLSSLPEAKITSAELSMTRIESGGALEFSAYEITSSWSDSSVSGSTAPSIRESYAVAYGSNAGYTSSFELKNSVQRIVDGDITNYGWLFKRDTDFGPDNYVRFDSSESTDASARPKLTVRYNVPPTRPVVIAPNGGELWSAEHLITWQPSTDAEGDPVVYEVQLSADISAPWETLATNTSGTSLSHNFLNEIESATALVRVRAFDGTSYSSWGTADGVFTIEHNDAPAAPTISNPKNGIAVDIAEVTRFAWKHNDANTSDAQSKADINYRVQGAAVWETIARNSSLEYYDFNTNTFTTATYEWRVRTYDQRGLASPWSNVAVFKAAQSTNAPEILAPATTANVARPVAEWSAIEQTSYRMTIQDGLGVEIWNSGEVISTVRAATIGIDLVNGGTYTLSLQVKDNGGIFSQFDAQTFTVSYTEPPKPVLTAEGAGHYVSVVITNPAATGTEPAVTGNDLYRRSEVETNWVRIAVGLGDAYQDHAVASGTNYEYKARANGDNNTSRESVAASSSVKFMGVYLHSVEDAAMTSHHYELDGAGKQSKKQAEHAFRRFAGRKKQTVEYGDVVDYAISASIQLLRNSDGAERLEQFVENMETICYRDGRGRLMFGVVNAAPLTDVTYGWETTIDVSEIDYSEEV